VFVFVCFYLNSMIESDDLFLLNGLLRRGL
jgi:hypothetical protein